ncbi:alpha/beta hydrolase [Pseudonocardia ailaonensis]|uniref:Alpha/beta hydrolase n=1 Tax=Pseudonocardia ailaonensis TaxID=367279 RepID=A0ABN2NAA8_9PSEU
MSTPGFRSVATEWGGATVRYDVREAPGASGIVFVPGWCCSRGDWFPMVESFEDFSSATLDLPGQGESASARTDWTIPEFGEVVSALVGELGWADVILVGHSMGGAVCVEAAALTAVKRVVCIDSLTYQEFYPRQSEESIAGVLDTIAADFRGTVTGVVNRYSVDRSDPVLRARIAEDLGRTSVPHALGSWRSLLEWDRDVQLGQVDVPISVIAASAFLDSEVAASLSDRLDIVPVDLGGHFFLREDPRGTAAIVRNVAFADSAVAPM